MINVVLCIIYNSKGEILLQKKTLDYKINPGKWSLFGGAAESDDFKKETDREVMEELGVKLSLKFEFNFDYEDIQQVESSPTLKKFHVFTAKIDDLSKLSIGEGAGIAFFGKDELKEIKLTPSCDYILKLFFKKGKESK